MHLRILINGTIDMVQKWKNDMAAVWLPYEITKGKTGAFQMGVRTMEMIDICFPEPCLDKVLDMVQPKDIMYRVKDGTKWAKTNRYPWLSKGLKWMRKAMKLDPIPEREYGQNLMLKPHVAVHGIGLKKDNYNDDGIELL